MSSTRKAVSRLFDEAMTVSQTSSLGRLKERVLDAIPVDVAPYVYRAEVVRVVDGDTVRLLVDVGFHGRHESNFRLLGIDAPEVRGAEKVEGKISTEAMKEKLGILTRPVDPVKVLVVTHKDPGKFGRWLGTIYLEDGTNLNEWMIENGYATEYGK